MGAGGSWTFSWNNVGKRRMSFLVKIFNFRKHLSSSSPYFSTIKIVNSRSLVPDDSGRTIYIVGSKKFPKWALFNCPCNQKHQLCVPLMNSVSPHWIIKIRHKKVTLSPSIYVNRDPCSSHFWLRENQIVWAKWDSV